MAQYLKQFRTVYLSAPLAAENRGEDWETALKRFYALLATGCRCCRAPPSTLFGFFIRTGSHWEDGGFGLTLRLRRQPLRVVLGIALGGFVTNADGEIHVIATNSPLVFELSYFKEVARGPTGTGIVHGDDPIVSSEQNTTVKRLWTIPETTTFLTFGRRRIGRSLMLILKVVGSTRQGA